MNIFQRLFQIAEFCMAVRSTHIWSMIIFEHKVVSRRIWGWWDILSLYYKWESLSVKEFWKFVSIWQLVATFFWTWC